MKNNGIFLGAFLFNRRTLIYLIDMPYKGLLLPLLFNNEHTPHKGLIVIYENGYSMSRIA